MSAICGQGEGNLKRIISFAALTAVCTSLALAGASTSSAGLFDGGLLGGILGSNCPTSGTKVFSRWGDDNLYFLGPKPFMKAVYANGLALGVPKQQLRYEFFGPLEALEA